MARLSDDEVWDLCLRSMNSALKIDEMNLSNDKST